MIEKALVDLSGAAFTHFAKKRDEWRVHDCYSQVGPIQFFGPKEITDTVPLTMSCQKNEC